MSLRSLSPIKRTTIKQGAPPITLADFIYSGNENANAKKQEDEKKKENSEGKS